MFLRAARLKKEEIGGAVVMRTFRSGTRFVRAGERLTPDDIMAMPAANRMAFIDKGYIAVWPSGGDAPVVSGKRFAIHIGGGAYDVIEGRKLNDKPLTKDEAKEMAKPPN